MRDSTNYHTLQRLLQKYLRPSDTLVSALAEHVIARSYGHKEIFLHREEIQFRIALLTEGAAIAVKTEQGQKLLTDLWRQDELILHAQSTVRMAKSKVDIIFLGDSKTLEIPTKALYQVREQFPEMAPYVEQFLTTDIEKSEAYADWLCYTPAKQRIKDFREQYPMHHYHLPVEYKVQYLNMSERWYQELLKRS